MQEVEVRRAAVLAKARAKAVAAAAGPQPSGAYPGAWARFVSHLLWIFTGRLLSGPAEETVGGRSIVPLRGPAATRTTERVQQPQHKWGQLSAPMGSEPQEDVWELSSHRGRGVAAVIPHWEGPTGLLHVRPPPLPQSAQLNQEMVEEVVQVTKDLDGRLQAALDAGLAYDTSDDEPNIVRQEMVDEVEQVPDNVPTTDCSCWDGMHADPDCMECDGSGLLFRE